MAYSKTAALSSLIVLTSLGVLHCGSSDDNNGGSAGSPAQAGAAPSGVAGSAGAASAGAPAAGSSSGGAGASAGGAPAAGSGGTGGSSAGAGGASAGASQGGSAGLSAGAGGQATGGGSSAGAGGQGGAGAFALTSSKLTAGMAFPAAHTCAGDDVSPPFAWGAGPSGTMSYALVLQDTFQNRDLVHWVLWDIPAATTSLPEALASTATLTMPAGAKQKSFTAAKYAGPCPSGVEHTYLFTLYAIDVATLPGVTTSSMTSALVTAIQAHDLASATLSATSNATKTN